MSRFPPAPPAPSGATVVAGVVGDPVAHSLSPILHNAAFQALGLDWVYVAFPVPSGAGEGIVEAVRTLALGGLNVTMPFKQVVARCADLRSPTVEQIGAANTLYWRSGKLVADSTDGAGLVDSLRHHHFEPAGRHVLVLGAGGAAAAVVSALAAAGAARVGVASLRPQAAAAVAALAGGAGHVADPEEASRADLVVQATPVGMEGGPNPGATVIDPGLLGPGQWLVDLVYHPLLTPLAEAAAHRGVTVIEGTWMLLYQAARSFRLWTGLEAPLQVMRTSLLSALSTSETGKKRP